MPIIPQKLDQFCQTYTEALLECVAAHPDEYFYTVANVPRVVVKMSAAFASGNYNIDGRAITLTCKRLGINCTYKAINAYLQNQ